MVKMKLKITMEILMIKMKVKMMKMKILMIKMKVKTMKMKIKKVNMAMDTHSLMNIQDRFVPFTFDYEIIG